MGMYKEADKTPTALVPGNLFASPAIWMTSSGRVTKHESHEHKGSAGEEKKTTARTQIFFNPRMTKHSVFVDHC